MNKYFIGMPVPKELVSVLTDTQELIKGNFVTTNELTCATDMHITLLYIGKSNLDNAKELYNRIHGQCQFDLELTEFEAFSNRTGPFALVLKVNDCSNRLDALAQILRVGQRPDFGFNPHITLSKLDGRCNVQLPVAARLLNNTHRALGSEYTFRQVALYEKVDGSSHYNPAYVWDLPLFKE